MCANFVIGNTKFEVAICETYFKGLVLTET